VDPVHRPESAGWDGNVILLRCGMVVEETHTLILVRLELRRAWQAQAAQIAAFLARLSAKPPLIIGVGNEWSRQSHNLSALDAQFDLHTPGHRFPGVKPLLRLDKIALSL